VEELLYIVAPKFLENRCAIDAWKLGILLICNICKTTFMNKQCFQNEFSATIVSGIFAIEL
jgi:hypothetical protein